MTALLYHQAQLATRQLHKRLSDALDQIDGAEDLRSTLRPTVHDRPLLVFTGQHSSGKSTLIKALTDGAAEVVIDSDISTDSVDEFDWDGVVRLVDTPGVQAGRDAHDELAEDALRSADLLVFTVTVELFDDLLVDHLQHVLSTLGKAPQTVIVMTKSGSLDAAPGIREDAVQAALGRHVGTVPWIECDADYYLRSLDQADSDPGRAASYREASNLGEVAALLNAVARARGDLARYSQPLQHISRIAAEAEASLSDDPEEVSALTVLARQRSALSERRDRIDVALERSRADFRSTCIRCADQFADAIEQLDAADGLNDAAMLGPIHDLNESLETARSRFDLAVERALEMQYADLVSELAEIEASPHARILVRLTQPDAVEVEGSYVAPKVGHTAHAGPPPWAKGLGKHLGEFKKFWGAGDGVRAAAGSPGHKIVLKVGHLFGKKFQPWEAVKFADKVGKFAKVGGAAIALGSTAYEVYADERAANQLESMRSARRRTITQKVLSECDALADEVLTGVQVLVDESFSAQLAEIDAVRDSIYSASSSRSALSDELHTIAAIAREEAESLVGPRGP